MIIRAGPPKGAESYAFYKYSGKTIVIGRGGRGAMVPLDKGVIFGIRWSKDRSHFIFVFEDDMASVVHVSKEQARGIAQSSKLVRKGTKWSKV